MATLNTALGGNSSTSAPVGTCPLEFLWRIRVGNGVKSLSSKKDQIAYWIYPVT